MSRTQNQPKVLKTKKVPASTVAKYVFGELTLKDVLPLVSDCSVMTLVAEGEETNWLCFTTIKGNLELWNDLRDDSPVWSFSLKTKVKVKEDHIELDARQGDMKMYFNRLAPIKINILDMNQDRK